MVVVPLGVPFQEKDFKQQGEKEGVDIFGGDWDDSDGLRYQRFVTRGIDS